MRGATLAAMTSVEKTVLYAAVLVCFPLATQAAPLDLARNLSLGSGGPDVQALQDHLRSGGYFTYPLSTGYYGPLTVAAVRAYQKDNGLPTVGVVGPLTRASLLREENKKPVQSPPAPAGPVQATTTSTTTASRIDNATTAAAPGGVVVTPRGVRRAAAVSYPVWLPQAPDGSYPYVYADFVNGHYWGGSAELALSTLLVSNADFAGTFNTAHVEAGVGLKEDTSSNTSFPVVASAYATEILAGTTAVMNIEQGNAQTIAEIGMYKLPSYSHGNSIYIKPSVGFPGSSRIEQYLYNDSDYADKETSLASEAGDYRTAVTMTPTKNVQSTNGSATETVAPPGSSAPDVTHVGFGMGGTNNALTPAIILNIAFYAPQDDADLPGMSDL